MNKLELINIFFFVISSAEELKYRNSLLPPHLRSTYAAQYDNEMAEDELKVSNLSHSDLINNLSSIHNNTPPTPPPIINHENNHCNNKHHNHNNSKNILHTSQLNNISSIDPSTTPKTNKTMHSTPLIRKMHPNITRIIKNLK